MRTVLLGPSSRNDRRRLAGFDRIPDLNPGEIFKEDGVGILLGYGRGGRKKPRSSVSAIRNRIQPPELFLFDSHPAHVDARHRGFAVDGYLLNRFDNLNAIDDATESRVLAVENGTRDRAR